MNIRDLFSGVEVVRMFGAADSPVTGLAYDSRRVLPGQVFFAIRGEKSDGHAFLSAALQRGAVAVASESTPEPGEGPKAWAQVAHARRALALAAANFYEHPAGALRLAGITGTNGKTTTAFLVHAILEAAGHVTGLFGTIEYRLGGRRLPAPHTTPESLDLQELLAELRGLGGSHAVMEVSSHALALDRIYGLPFAVAVFTNLTRDHLDFHRDMESYFAAKKKLFTGAGAPPPGAVVLNADDPRSAELVPPRRDSPRVVWYGLEKPADVRPEGADAIRTPAGQVRNRSRLVGRPNAYNVLAATAAAVALGIAPEAIEQGLAALESVPGRFERVEAGQPFPVIVDYAHTDDALRNVLAAARSLNPRQVITVFGCGGDRDRAKRPLMGEAAAEASELVIITSDNPRSEDPLRIIEDALPGVRKVGRPFHVEPDRAQAIEMALEEARREAGSLVLIAGKGHETYQVIGNERRPFDDRQVAREALRKMGFSTAENAESAEKNQESSQRSPHSPR